jgi:hypothetical protein
MSTILKILAIIAILIFAFRMSPPKIQESPDLSAAKQKLQIFVEEKPKENWQSIRVPVSNEDGTIYVYDKNSVSIVKYGQNSEVELTAKIIRGDRTVVGKIIRLSFLCDGRARINNSYPVAVPDLSQEEYMQNISCGVKACMQWDPKKSIQACLP